MGFSGIADLVVLLQPEINQVVTSDRLYALYVVALTTGRREGEILGLSWADVDFQAKQLRVHQQLPRLDGRLQLVEPKASASRHMVALTPWAEVALRAHRERQLFERRAAGEAWQESGLVFATTIGTPFEPRNLVRSFKSALRKAGIADRRFMTCDIRQPFCCWVSMWIWR